MLVNIRFISTWNDISSIFYVSFLPRYSKWPLYKKRVKKMSVFIDKFTVSNLVWYYCRSLLVIPLLYIFKSKNCVTTNLKLLKVYFHKKNDAMWISLGDLPKKMSSHKLNVVSISELVSIDITLTEVFSSTLNKQSSPCSEELTVDFNTCSQTYFVQYFKNNTNCALPGIDWNLKKVQNYIYTLQFVYINRQSHIFNRYGIFQ